MTIPWSTKFQNPNRNSKTLQLAKRDCDIRITLMAQIRKRRWNQAYGVSPYPETLFKN